MPLSPGRDRRSLRSPGGPGSSRNRDGVGMHYPRTPSSSGMGGGGYKVLCVSALHPKASDDVIRDTLYREYKKFGDISVRVIQEPDERVAYVYFRSFDEARDAKHNKSRIILFDRPALVEAVYESRSEPSYARRPRSITPPPPHYSSSRYRARSRSPIYERNRYHRDYREEYYPSARRDYYPRDGPSRHPPHHMNSRGGGQHRASRGGYNDQGYDNNRHMKRENKKDKFPNYLDHKAPEDDPLATRTLFLGNLELNITEEEMKRIFGRFGKLVDIDIKRPPPGTGNAYAFIRFENLDQAHKAKVELSGQYIGKFQCKIGYGKVNATPKVWVGGLGAWTSVSLLEREFDRFGAIQKIEYEKGDANAFVFYETLDAAQAAVQEMRGFPLGGPDKRIRIDYSDLEEFSNSSNEYPKNSNRGRGGKYPSYSSRANMGGRDANRDDWDDSRRSPELDQLSPPSESPQTIQNFSEVKSIEELSNKISISWEGGLILKSSIFPSQFHQLEGDTDITELLKDESSGLPQLKITQRLRLDNSKIEEVSRRMKSSTCYGIFLCFPSGNNDKLENSEIQSRPLRNLVSYLKQKTAAGVISLNSSSPKTGVLYCFPPCAFSFELINREAPRIAQDETMDDHLVILVICEN